MLITLLGVFANLLIGTVVVLKTKISRDKILFFLLTLSISVWSIFNYLSLTSTVANTTLHWMRLVMLCAVLQPTLFLIFALSYTKKLDAVRNNLPPYFLSGAAVIILTQTPWLFSGIAFDLAKMVRHPIITNPTGIIIFSIYTIGSFIAGITIMVRALFKAKGSPRTSLLLMLVGLFLMFLLLIVFNFLLPTVLHIYRFVYIGPLFALPFVYLTAIAIIEFELFEIRIITTKILLTLVGMIFLLELFSGFDAQEQIVRSIFLASLGVLCAYLIKKIESERYLKVKQLYELTIKHRNLRRDHQANMAFISDIAHRLKTPLAIIQVKSAPGQPASPQTLKGINEVAKTTVATLRNIVQTGKIDAELVKLDRRTLDLALWLRELTPDLIALAPDHTIRIPTPSTPLTAQVDRLYLREALYNLVDNARKFSPIGSTIELSARAANQQIELSVTDHGRGITEKDLSHIFERHYQADGTRQQFAGSAGLGLSLVKWVAEAHDGHVSVTSTPNRSTTFTLVLPAVTPVPSPHRKPIKQIVIEG